MRKQYHFRPSEQGLRAWDVHRLIALSEGLPVRRVALDTIGELEEVYWFDDDLEHPTCRKVLMHMRLIQEADLRYPILLVGTRPSALPSDDYDPDAAGPAAQPDGTSGPV
jgi:hypothetical protein